jgi:hypothetical protein
MKKTMGNVQINIGTKEEKNFSFIIYLNGSRSSLQLKDGRFGVQVTEE